MMPLNFMVRATVAGLVALGLAGCSSEADRDASQGATSNAASVTLTGLSAGTAGTTSAEDPTSGGGSGTGGGSTSMPAESTGSPAKFDLGEQPMVDLGGEMTGPIIPTTCDEAASGKSTVGCKFFAVDMDAHDGVEGSQYAVGVANVQLAAMATVTVEVKEGGVWQTIGGPQPIGPLQLFTFNLPDRHNDDSALKVGGAYRVTSDVPVVA